LNPRWLSLDKNVLAGDLARQNTPALKAIAQNGGHTPNKRLTDMQPWFPVENRFLLAGPERFPAFLDLYYRSRYLSFTINAAILLSNKCPIVGKQTKAFFEMETLVVTTA